MSQQISIGGQVSSVNGAMKAVLSLTDNFTTTSSNAILNAQSIPTGSWTIVDQGSNPNFRYGFFVNTDLTSSCKLAITTPGTASYAAYLQPGDVAIIPASGSTVIYAEAVGANSPIVIQYFLTPS